MYTYSVLALTLVSYVLCQGIYNRYFHPLRAFPGPFWASVSDFFKLWILHTKQAHTLGLEYHQKYGSIVRAAPNLLAVDDPMLLPLIYHRRVDKTDVYTVGVLGEIAPPFQTLKHEEHAIKRKRVAASFTLTNLKHLEGQVDERIAQWTHILTQRFVETGEELDFAAWSQWFAYDMICQLSFGEPIGFVSQGRDVENLIANFHQMAPFAAVVGALPWLARPFLENPITRKFFMPKPGDGSGTGKIMAFRDRLLADRLNNPQAHKQGDFLDNILSATNPDGTPITLEEVKTECFVLMFAASDTTAAFFCGFVRYVLETPGIYERLVAEIDEYDQRGDLTSPVPRYDEIKDMRYFTACYKETMRYQPSTPMIIPRYVSPGGLTLHNQHIPAGTEIGANPYVVHRNHRVFGEDADVFRPDRWLVADPDHIALMDKCILTWGYGTRICLGKNIALLETYKLLVQFFRLFRPQINNGTRPIWKQENLALLVHHNFWIKIASRKH
ncbi:cytochrome P450 [Aspergillus fijiensis CBS 313.89]|uniref:Cytochrome P450 monooxygenase n=1 Tax=Aspergillus fijiensis CBS 313.89 TaxID=1448319 RepID=A0A8G1REB9_9EURO|nr:cytochrome P450 monooxygenase [Aspergillus fijiensis CBS 313.89]RAK71705.1 cytochrome P450 monooxygenase [Aspergillus fijiensis CBS 313.89]